MYRMLALTATGVIVSLLIGCASPDVSNLLSAGAKLASDPSDPPIGDLTAAEFMAIYANLPQLAAQFPELGILAGTLEALPPLSLQQAEDLVAFLEQYNIRTISDLQRLLVQVAEGEIEVVVPDSLIEFAAALGFETDAARLADIL
ncbi:MAG TPA: hypothetical protein PL151_03745 [Phycisphaerae bacterium]|nr:hypothetical protein [Phycisphaerae bacterium]HQA00183.1 hypothetical protein [Phycisphaerae bacterium]HQE26851.1 hypothetical protein [Phycisphaerae bacterium]